MKTAVRLVSSALSAAALGFVAAPAHADFHTETCSNGGCPGDIKFYNGDAQSGVTGFVGSIGAEHGGPPVTVDTFVDVNTGAGYSTIKPSAGSVLTELLFTPTNSLGYSDFSFRGQIEQAGFSNQLTITVNGCLDVGGVCSPEAPQVFQVTEDAGHDADFTRIGIAGTLGETILSVAVQTAAGASFKEFKEVNFSPASIVPEPATWALMLVGFGGLGATVRARRKALNA